MMPSELSEAVSTVVHGNKYDVLTDVPQQEECKIDFP